MNTLLRPDSEIVKESATDTTDLTRAAITLDDILSTLTSSILSPRPFGSPAENSAPDLDYEEKALRTIVTYLAGEPKGAEADDDVKVKKDVKKLVEMRATDRGKGWGLEPSDWKTLETSAGA